MVRVWPHACTNDVLYRLNQSAISIMSLSAAIGARVPRVREGQCSLLTRLPGCQRSRRVLCTVAQKWSLNRYDSIHRGDTHSFLKDSLMFIGKSTSIAYMRDACTLRACKALVHIETYFRLRDANRAAANTCHMPMTKPQLMTNQSAKKYPLPALSTPTIADSIEKHYRGTCRSFDLYRARPMTMNNEMHRILIYC